MRGYLAAPLLADVLLLFISRLVFSVDGSILDHDVLLRSRKRPTLAICYVATKSHFWSVWVSLYSLIRVLSPQYLFFDLAIHLFCVPSGEICSLADLQALPFFDSISPIPVVVHTHFDLSWLTLWDAARRDGKGLIWVSLLSLRLFLPWMVTEDYIFYVDADTLWGRDFRPELHELLLAHPDRRLYICWDCSAYRPDPPDWFMGYLRAGDHKAECFGNAGVFILLNDGDDIWRRLAIAVPVFNRHQGMWPDQDVINYMYSCKEKHLMPAEWNNHANCLDSVHRHKHGLGDAIIHHGHRIPFPEISMEFELRLNASLVNGSSVV
jgi:hypothetical protein